MKKEYAKKWIAALRSGEYAQGTGALYEEGYLSDQPEYCVLGVLHKVASVGNRNPSQNAGELGDTIKKRVGMKTRDGALPEGCERLRARNLIELNDSYRMTFLELANVIEEIWEKL